MSSISANIPIKLTPSVPTAEYEIKRLDHLGRVAGIIKKLKIIERIDEHLGTDEGETLSVGETVSSRNDYQ